MSDFNSTHNRAVWIDIPVADLDRAAAFYAAVLDITVHFEQFNEIRDLEFSIMNREMVAV